MPLDPATIDAMVSAGFSAEQIATVVKAELLADRAAAVAADEARKARAREGNRERQARWRERHNANNGVTGRDEALPPKRSPAPPKNTPQDSTPSDPKGSSAPRGARRSSACLCPADFEAGEAHFAKAAERGFDRGFVLATAQRMHRWSHANANRPVARKSDWGLAFHGFLDRAMNEAPSPSARGSPPRRGTGNGYLDALFDDHGAPDEPASGPHADDHGNVHRLAAGGRHPGR